MDEKFNLPVGGAPINPNFGSSQYGFNPHQITPCPTCGRCPTCGQYKPQLLPYQQQLQNT